MGRTFVRAALNSARNIRPQDNSPQAAAARRIAGFHELDGLEFVARIDIERDGRGDMRNVVKMAVEPGHPDYAQGAVAPAAPFTPAAPAMATQAPQAASTMPPPLPAPGPAPRGAAAGKPAWAQ